MWTLHEAYEPSTEVLYLYLVGTSAEAPVRPGLDAPRLVESFADLDTARRFVDGYEKALSYDDGHVVRAVRCGAERPRGCRGPGQPCALGLDCYRCEIRGS